MLMKMLRHILILLAFASPGVGHAADMKIDCRLKGGSVVQLTAEACGIEGGASANEAIPPPPAAVAGSADEGAAKDQPPVDTKLAATQKAVVALLDKPVVDATPLNRNPEGIERTARFDGCRLMVDEVLHIKYGNLFSVWKDFKISSVIDLHKISRDEFGVLKEINSKGGGLKAAAVYVEERKGSGDISIAVLEPKNGGYAKYRSHGPSAYWSASRNDLWDDLWIADEYGYPKETVLGNVATDKVRILLIINTADDAEKLKAALQDIQAICKSP
ncbi:MAG: hypothetical protein ABI536_00105 [Gallionella sp.]